MNVVSKLKTACTIYNKVYAKRDPNDFPEDYDRYGDPVSTEVEVQTHGLFLPQTLPSIQPEIEVKEDIIHATFLAFFAQNVEVYGDSRIAWTDHFGISHDAQVYGVPARIEDTHARPVVIQCTLKETQLL